MNKNSRTVMKLSISEMIANKFIQNGHILTEDKELYAYGIRQSLLMVLNIITTIIIGSIFGMYLQSIIFLITYIPIRIYSGGYHAKTQFRCYLLSIGMIFTALLIIRLNIWTNFICLMVTAIAVSIIYFLSPVENINKKLDKQEVIVYKSKARQILLVEVFILVTLICLEQLEVAICISIALFMLSFMLILGKFKNIIKIG